MIWPISAKQPYDWGLVGIYKTNSKNLLKKYLLQLRLPSKMGNFHYKRYTSNLDDSLMLSKPKVPTVNVEVFFYQINLKKISR